MHNRLYYSALILLLTLLISKVNAQPGTISISGKITALAGGQPVAQASININNKGIGTATNAAGMFLLIIPAANFADTLKVSCIGFKTQKFAINSLKDKAEINIKLQKTNDQLKEVTIAYYDAPKIIQKALSRIADNYINHPHILRGFYRMYTYADTAPLQLSEAVFDIYNFGYSDTHADLFKLIKARNEKNNRDLGSLEFGQKPNSIFEEDLVNHLYTSGFLNEAGLKNHTFEVTGIVDFKGYEAYQINFKEKPNVADGTFSGRMFITTKTYAFIYFDYGLSPSGLTDLASGNFVTHALMNAGDAQISIKQDHATVTYQQVGNKWVLAGVAGTDVLTINRPGTKANITANVNFNYQVTAVDTIAKKPFGAKLGRNENINHYESGTGERFWKDYNILLSDYDTEAIFKQLQILNKLK